MKGFVFEEGMNSSLGAWVGGEPPRPTRRIIIPDANNLVITKTPENVFASTGFKREYTPIREISVPEELVRLATAHAETQSQLLRWRDLIGNLAD